MATIRFRLDQTEAVLANGVSIAALAREVGMPPQALQSYIVRTRNQWAGLTQDGKVKAPVAQPGE